MHPGIETALTSAWPAMSCAENMAAKAALITLRQAPPQGLAAPLQGCCQSLSPAGLETLHTSCLPWCSDSVLSAGCQAGQAMPAQAVLLSTVGR